MTAVPATPADAAALREGRPPASPELLRYLEVPQPGWTGFLRREYLAGFIAEGGTKLKLLVGTPGCGKSHLLALAASLAREEGYLVAELDAAGARLFPIDRFYGAVVRAAGVEPLTDACALAVVRELGFDLATLPPRRSFLEYAVREGLAAEGTLRRSLHEQVDRLVRNGELSPAFALGAAQQIGDRLGIFHLNALEREALVRWFTAQPVRLGEIRSMQLFERPDRYNAREYLRSLAVLARHGRFRGLAVFVDNMETLAHRTPGGRQRYTRAQRDEAYETLRQLIDDVDHARHTLYVLAGRREFVEDEKAGLSSYEALRLRLLPEVRADRFNPYADIVDLNEARADGYVSPAALAEWMERLREYHAGAPGAPLPSHLSLRDLVVSLASEPAP